MLKDVISRNGVRNTELLERIHAYIYDNLGNQISLRKIADFLKHQKRSADLETIGNYLQLLRRRFKVYTEKSDEREIDFIAEKANEKIYVQVCYEFSNFEATKERAFLPLKETNDQYPKYVVTLDKNWNINDEGVKGIHLNDFLLLKLI